MRFAIMFFALASACLAIALVAAESPPVNVRVRAPWEPTSLLLELIEGVSTEDPPAFWTLLDTLPSSKSSRNKLAEASAKDIHATVKSALDRAGLLTDLGRRSNWEAAAALHAESPKVAAFAQLARTSGTQALWERSVGSDTALQEACGSWVDWYGQVICSPADFETALGNGPTEAVTVATYPFDHIKASVNAERNSPTAVFYASPLSDNFNELHQALLGKAKGQSGPPFRYILRWRSMDHSDGRSKSSGFLSGYAATLDLKKVDYLVIDDRKLKHASGAPSLAGREQNAVGQAQLDDRARLNGQLTKRFGNIDRSSPLTEEEIADLSVKAAQFIAQSADPIKTLKQLTHDFPLHAASLARGKVTVSPALLEEVATIQSTMIRPGTGDVWLNGKTISSREILPQGLVKLMRSERTLVDALTAGPLKLSAGEAVDLLSDPAVARAEAADKAGAQIFDASDRIERAAFAIDDDTPSVGAIQWLNDVEKDTALQRLNPSLSVLLQPLFPGSFPPIKRNLFNIVLVSDLSLHNNSRNLADQLFPMVGRSAMRFGFIPGGIEQGPDSDATKFARAFWDIVEHEGAATAGHWLDLLTRSSDEQSEKIDLQTARKGFAQALKQAVSSRVEKASEIFDRVVSERNPRESPALAYIRRLRLTNEENAMGHLLINSQYSPIARKSIFSTLSQVIATQTQFLKGPVYYGQLTDDMDVSTYFFDLPSAMPSRSALVFPPLQDAGAPPVVQPRALTLKDFLGSDESQRVTSSFIYPENTQLVNATVWLVGDLDIPTSVDLLKNVLQAQKTMQFRLGLIHQAGLARSRVLEGSGVSLSTLLAQLQGAGQFDKLTPVQLLETLDELTESGSGVDESGQIQAHHQQVFSDDETARTNEAKARGWNIPAAVEAQTFWSKTSSFVEAVGVKPGDFAIVVNGRALVGFDPATVQPQDMQTLLKNENSRRIDPVLWSLERLVPAKLAKLSKHDRANAIALASSAMTLNYFVDETKVGMFTPSLEQRTNVFDRVPAKHTGVQIGNRDKARLRFSVIVDPLSQHAQRWISVLAAVANLPDVSVHLILNPTRDLTEMPLKRFFRYSAPLTLSFDKDGNEIAPTLSFLEMPEDAVLTMGLETPPPWLTQTAEAVYDLDNILLRDVPEDGREAGVLAVYDLKEILIEGHARQGVDDIPAGLQLVLETPDGSETLDTIVMENLAYFQFRAKPGLWKLSIRPGRSDELYKMLSVGNLGWDSPDVSVTGNDITLDSLEGLTIYPRVAKRPGKEDEELLESIDAGDAKLQKGKGSKQGSAGSGNAKNLMGSWAQRPSPDGKAPAGVAKSNKTGDEDINIFTVASGHLYERMTYIMILSVLRHTQKSVKFWFIENFLSPSFKHFIPYLAAEYGFKYEMITYAWPHWLRPQQEKQRTIWGYKILFLDVLFPLDIDKVIFVDSDQVVRTDMQDLVDVDLEGASYGFPPMGNDSEDMDGYRFWKSGYWATLLKGRPYHISALYVVDLNRFRSVAAGDKLRAQYQALSQDPNSLANLDQDLPQTLIWHVPIHTLDQEWLWCETWCSDSWLDKARTIDLCSNPKTHEPKLSRARRQIPEWTELDDEVQALARKVGEERGKEGEGVVVLEEKTEAEEEEDGSAERLEHPHDEL